jgi:hypothetical protein
MIPPRLQSFVKATACFLLLLTAASLPADEPVTYVKSASGERLIPHVAVDNVTAWPNLTLMPNGEIIASIFNQPSHGSVEGEVECWATTDQGKNWEKRGVPAPHEPHTNRMNCAVGLAGNGDLVAIVSGWSDQPIAGQTQVRKGAFRAAALDPHVSRSSDGGRTWKVSEHSLPARCPDGGISIPFGDILPGEDGKLRVVVYSAAKNMVGKDLPDSTFIFRSDDDGLTWTDPVPLDKERPRNETAFFHLGQGQWIAAARYKDLGLYRSEDDAQTWKYVEAVTQKDEFPAHLMRLRDGRILLTYGDRTASKGVEIRLSSDEGKTWSKPLRLLDFTGDGGYPSSVQLPDGNVLTVYYAAAIAGHERYHLGVVTWNPADVGK